jgi:hypothetical protein
MMVMADLRPAAMMRSRLAGLTLASIGTPAASPSASEPYAGAWPPAAASAQRESGLFWPRRSGQPASGTVSAPTSRRKDWGRRRDTGVAGNHEVAQRDDRGTQELCQKAAARLP